MSHDDERYEDLSADELADEIAGLDKEIEDLQTSSIRLRKAMKQKHELRESLLDIVATRRRSRGWHKS